MFFRRKPRMKSSPPGEQGSIPLSPGKYRLAFDFTVQEIAELRHAIASSPYMLRRKSNDEHTKHDIE